MLNFRGLRVLGGGFPDFRGLWMRFWWHAGSWGISFARVRWLKQLLETHFERNSNLSHSLELKQGSTLGSLYNILVHMSCRCKTASLTSPGLCFLADFGETREASVGIPCFAMEYIPNMSMRNKALEAVSQVEFSWVTG